MAFFSGYAPQMMRSAQQAQMHAPPQEDLLERLRRQQQAQQGGGFFGGSFGSYGAVGGPMGGLLSNDWVQQLVGSLNQQPQGGLLGQQPGGQQPGGVTVGPGPGVTVGPGPAPTQSQTPQPAPMLAPHLSFLGF